MGHKHSIDFCETLLISILINNELVCRQRLYYYINIYVVMHMYLLTFIFHKVNV